MSRIRSLTPSLATRRNLLIVLAVGAALLVATGLLREPGGRERASDDTVAATSGTDPATALVDPAVNLATPREGDAAKTELRGATSEALAPQASGGGIASDAAVPATETTVSTLAAPPIDARIVRTGSIELRVRRGRFEDAWSDAQAVARANGGYVLAASRSGAGKGPRTGTITIRVPSRRFDAAVDRLRDIDRTNVERLDVASQDVTQEFVDVRSRLRHDRAVEARLVMLLARTETVSEVLAVQSRLDQVQEQIEVSKGRLDYLDAMTTTSTIELALAEPGATTTSTDKDEPSVISASLADARERFSENVASAVVWLGGALPALLMLAAIGLVARSVLHRRAASTVRADDPAHARGEHSAP